MNFAFSEEQQALRDQARKFLSDRAAPARVRRILESDEPFDRELWRGIGELAWTGTAIPESLRRRRLRLSRALRARRGARPQPRPHALLVLRVPRHRGAAARGLPGAEEAVAARAWPSARPSAASRWPRARARRIPAPSRRRRAAAASAAPSCRWPTATWPTSPSSPRGSGRGRPPPCRSTSRSWERRGVTRARVDTVDPTRSHARITFEGAAAEPLGAAGGGLAAARAAARSRRRALRLRAGGRRPGRARDGARLCARPLRLRPAHRLLPGHQAQARRRLRRRSSWRAPTPTTPPGRCPPRPPSCRWRRRPRAWPRARPSSTPPRRISRPTAAWASPGSSTATCTIAAPSCSP